MKPFSIVNNLRRIRVQTDSVWQSIWFYSRWFDVVLHGNTAPVSAHKTRFRQIHRKDSPGQNWPCLALFHYSLNMNKNLFFFSRSDWLENNSLEVNKARLRRPCKMLSFSEYFMIINMYLKSSPRNTAVERSTLISSGLSFECMARNKLSINAWLSIKDLWILWLLRRMQCFLEHKENSTLSFNKTIPIWATCIIFQLPPHEWFTYHVSMNTSNTWYRN